MRFLRLRVANYRGFDTREVNFGPLGITLVQGPNEAGKTSLARRSAFSLNTSIPANIARLRPSSLSTGTRVPR